MKLNTKWTAALAAAIMLVSLAPSWAAFESGVYQNGSTRVRVLINPATGSSPQPQSTRVFDIALQLVNELAAQVRRSGTPITVTTGVSGANPVIRVSAGQFGEATVTFTRVGETTTSNSASWTTRVSARGLILQNTISRAFSVVETFVDSASGMIEYSSSTTDSEFTQFNTPTVLLSRISTGIGTETDPILPINPSWISPVIVVVAPIFINGRATWIDPPYAKGFEYLVKSGRPEKIAKVVAPRGFGPRIKVFAASRRNGPLRFVGTVASGRSISLTRFPGLAAGAAKVRLQGMNPRPDLSTEAPYPVGFTFRNLREANTVLEIKPIKAS